jgi:hypothetical protein
LWTSFLRWVWSLVVGCRWGTSLSCFTWVSFSFLDTLRSLFFFFLWFWFVFWLWYCRVEVEVYKTLDPGIRVVILKALCDIRVEVTPLAAKIIYNDSWFEIIALGYNDVGFLFTQMPIGSHFSVQISNTCRL